VGTANETQTQHKRNREGHKIEQATKGDSDCHPFPHHSSAADAAAA